MKLEGTSAQPGLKFIASKGNGLAMVVWTCDFTLGHCGPFATFQLTREDSVATARRAARRSSTRVRMDHLSLSRADTLDPRLTQINWTYESVCVRASSHHGYELLPCHEIRRTIYPIGQVTRRSIRRPLTVSECPAQQDTTINAAQSYHMWRRNISLFRFNMVQLF